MARAEEQAGTVPVGASGIPLPKTRISQVLDGIVVWIGETSSLIWTILMLLIIVQVIQRYVIGLGSIQMEEAQWHLFAIGFMLGLSLAAVRERHVRIDVLAENWAVRTRQWIELIGIIAFLLPLCMFVIWWSIPYVYEFLAG